MRKVFISSFLFLLSILLTNGATDKCGKVKVKAAAGLSVGSLPAYKGQFPWLATLFHKDRYVCGSSIISQWHLLSAAHCVIGHSGDFHTLLGRFNISDASESNWIRRNISEIHVHEKFDADAKNQRSNGDIAIFKVAEIIQYTNFIQPICLPEPSANVINVNGFVAGHGATESLGFRSDTPNYITLKTIDNWSCLDKGFNYGKIVSEFSFCGGNDASTPCLGDGGSGFHFYNRSTMQYTIYGIVSYGIFNCDPKHFTVFTEVTKYIDWIQEKTKVTQKSY